MSTLLKNKIRKYINLLKKSKIKYTLKEAYDLVCSQIKQEEALNEEDMECVKDDIWTRLNENWPFKDLI